MLHMAEWQKFFFAYSGLVKIWDFKKIANYCLTIVAISGLVKIWHSKKKLQTIV